MQKTVLIFIKQVRYYQGEGSLVIVGVEAETRKPITQQITVKAFLSSTGKFTVSEIDKIVNDPDRCKRLASNLQDRKEPFKLLFEGTKKPDDEQILPDAFPCL